MNHQRRRRTPAVPPCREIGSDDGIDPRYYFRPARNHARHDRKTLQLCAQVAQAVQLALSACDDPLLQPLLVLHVKPTPDVRSLEVCLTAADVDVPVPVVQRHLLSVRPLLRAAVAQAVHRKRVPTLSLIVGASGEAS